MSCRKSQLYNSTLHPVVVYCKRKLLEVNGGDRGRTASVSEEILNAVTFFVTGLSSRSSVVRLFSISLTALVNICTIFISAFLRLILLTLAVATLLPYEGQDY